MKLILPAQLQNLWLRWKSISPRERLYLSVCAGFIVLVLMYTLIYEPITKKVNTLSTEQLTQTALLQRMKPRITILKYQTHSSSSPISASELLSTIDTKIKSSRFASNVEEVSQSGTDGVQIKLKGVPFDNFLAWLGKMWTQNGIEVKRISAQRDATIGTSDVTVTLGIRS